MEVGEIRLDGTTRTIDDILPSLLEVKEYKKFTFYSLVKDREQIDFNYLSTYGEIECSLIREVNCYTGNIKYNGIYYNIPSEKIKEMYNSVVVFIIMNK